MRTLYDQLPGGAEGGIEFARIVNLLLFHEARRAGRKFTAFSDAAGDFHGLDSFQGDASDPAGIVGYQYKFYPSPLSAAHRAAIKASLAKAIEASAELNLTRWILITPDDPSQSGTRRGGGDVQWFQGLRDELGAHFSVEHIGHTGLQTLFLNDPPLSLFYYPELVPDGAARRHSVEDTRSRYDENFRIAFHNIDFVGLAHIATENARGVPMDQIYIPLSLVRAGVDDRLRSTPRTDPLTLLPRGKCSVILGDPGSGKSTLLRFLGLAGITPSLQNRQHAQPDGRLPIYVVLRRYADELRSQPNLALLDYIRDAIAADFSLKSADFEFLEYYLESQQAVLLFDGLDELPDDALKSRVRDRIQSLVTTYPGNTTFVSSRVIGYDHPFRLSDERFDHYQVGRLRQAEIEQFVQDWYRARVESEGDRARNLDDLLRILKDPRATAIRQLAENPLLLTIIALVHRLDVLPDERAMLYQKCTDTLLATWYSWKLPKPENRSSISVERRNRRRLEAIAHWMHERGGTVAADQRAVVAQSDLVDFLADYIVRVEKRLVADADAELVADARADAQDVADDFVRFVKGKTGLLVELGDRFFSFLHLTFQEYLTAAYLQTRGEAGGVASIWTMIGKHADEPRWQEVTRLLIAGLKSDESQRYLIDRLLEGDPPGINRPLLLSGLLLDGIGAAEDAVDETVRRLIRHCAEAPDGGAVAQLLNAIQALDTRVDVSRGPLRDALWQRFRDGAEPLPLALIAHAAGLLDPREDAWAELLRTELDFAHDPLTVFLGYPARRPVAEQFAAAGLHAVFEIQQALLAGGQTGAAAAALIESVVSSLPLATNKQSFELQLIAAARARVLEPALDRLVRPAARSVVLGEFDGEGYAPGLLNEFLIELEPRPILHGGFRIKWLLSGDSFNFTRPFVRLRLRTTHGYDWISAARTSGAFLGVPQLAWKSGARDPRAVQFIADVLIAAFALQPAAQWRAALAVSLPAIWTAATRWTSQDALAGLLERSKAARQQLSDEDVYAWACLILLDDWARHAKGATALPETVTRIPEQFTAPAIRLALRLRQPIEAADAPASRPRLTAAELNLFMSALAPPSSRPEPGAN